MYARRAKIINIEKEPGCKSAYLTTHCAHNTPQQRGEGNCGDKNDGPTAANNF
jgi:hypothetical protein